MFDWPFTTAFLLTENLKFSSEIIEGKNIRIYNLCSDNDTCYVTKSSPSFSMVGKICEARSLCKIGMEKQSGLLIIKGLLQLHIPISKEISE